MSSAGFTLPDSFVPENVLPSDVAIIPSNEYYSQISVRQPIVCNRQPLRRRNPAPPIADLSPNPKRRSAFASYSPLSPGQPATIAVVDLTADADEAGPSIATSAGTVAVTLSVAGPLPVVVIDVADLEPAPTDPASEESGLAMENTAVPIESNGHTVTADAAETADFAAPQGRIVTNDSPPEAVNAADAGASAIAAAAIGTEAAANALLNPNPTMDDVVGHRHAAVDPMQHADPNNWNEDDQHQPPAFAARAHSSVIIPVPPNIAAFLDQRLSNSNAATAPGPLFIVQGTEIVPTALGTAQLAMMAASEGCPEVDMNALPSTSGYMDERVHTASAPPYTTMQVSPPGAFAAPTFDDMLDAMEDGPTEILPESGDTFDLAYFD